MRSFKLLQNLTVILVIFIVSKPFEAHSQSIDEFPEDSAKYAETLTEFLEKRIKESNEALVEDFIKYWSTGKFTPQRRDSIVKVSNMLLHNRGKREPHFTKMMNFFIELNDTQFDSLYFDIWMKGFRHAMGFKRSKLKRTMNYLDFTLHFIDKNALNIANTRNWYSTSEDYKFHYDSTIKITYKNTTLKCKLRNDSIQIFNTQGTYYPFSKNWKGKKGKVTWERAGYSPENIYAVLNDYKLNMQKASYTADSVEFINKLYFDEPVFGKLEDHLVHVIKPQDAIYPEFKSYKKIFELKDIYENMDFTGGFVMKGAQFIGSGGENKDAILKVHRNGQTFMTARSQTFVLKKEDAVSRKAEISIHLKQDSIYHTGIQFTYNVNSHEIELTPNENLLSESVYYDTYHQISMKLDRLLWNTKEDTIHFTYSRNSSEGTATFTSMNYFTLKKWLKLEMRDDIHPLIGIRNFYNKIDSRRFHVGDYAKYAKKPTNQVEQRLMKLALDGFIFYDLDNDTITINDKLFDFIKSRIDKIDYDVINLQSTTEAPTHNGILDLKTMDLKINGVPRVQVSDSQNVIIYPENKQIVMGKNRDFEFGGVVEAGLFSYFGDDFDFDYENFKITLDNIDSLNMKFQTDEKNMYGRAVLQTIENTIEDLSGDIFIDKPDNKSGKENYPKYPIFESKQKSYVYYDDLFNGPYEKENFYFELDTFKMDSLDNFKPENLKFKGTFHSANIFPQFRETLMLREDNSLGLKKETPDSGFPLYEGKGKYYNTIDMSNRGLRGEGKLTYLTSEAVTDDILFFPDSTSIHANKFNISQQTSGVEYPKVNGKGINIKWYPHENVMHTEQTDQPYTMYNDSTTMKGKLKLKPTGLTGRGKLDLSKAILRSQNFTYESTSFDADTANFKLRTLDHEDFAFLTDTLNAHIDFDYQRGRFRTIENYSISEFPKNNYLGYINKFSWKMDENELEVKSKPQPKTTYGKTPELEALKDADLPGALYLSTHKGQDSLRFISPEMNYKLQDNTINAKEVEFIALADARIQPHEGKVTVEEGAKVRKLEEAVILTDTADQYHRFFNAEVQIKSRYDYTANGDYEYIDKNDSSQIIYFEKIGVDSSVNTFAEGTITQPDSFKLSPNYAFAGDVFIKSQRELMRFRGGAQIFHNCPSVPSRYVKFETIINPDNIYIPIGEQIRDINRENIFAGPFITIDTTHIYSSFLSPRKDASDEQIVSADGYLHFKENSNNYLIGTREKINNPDTTGPLLKFDKEHCWTRAEGEMNLGVDYGKMKIKPVGKISHNIKEDDITLDLSLPIDFHYSEAALDTMIKDIKSRKNLKHVDLSSNQYEKNLNELMGIEKASNYLNEAKLFGDDEIDIPEELKQTIVFSDIDFQWNTSTDSYIAQDDIGIAMINGEPINRYVDGYVEIIKQTQGDKIYIYLKLDDERFYYFYYFRKIMRTWSDNKDFRAAIKEVPNRKRTIRDGFWIFGSMEFRYMLSTDKSFSRFKKHKREAEQELLKRKQEEEEESNSSEKDKEQEEQEKQDEGTKEEQSENKKQEDSEKEKETDESEEEDKSDKNQKNQDKEENSKKKEEEDSSDI
ncbi:MAG: hypothetical protein ACQESJ_01350 [Bacteroidota bacterium]